VEYKIHQYRFDNFTKHENVIHQAMSVLGHTESQSDIADIDIYNHCHISEVPAWSEYTLIFKPTGPTSDHFAIDTHGYANSSTLAFKEPIGLKKEYTNNSDISELIKSKSNKWDDSIMVKWKDDLRKNFPKDHVLVIVQQPKDETVDGFGFGNHWTKICSIVAKLLVSQTRPIVVKLHPSFQDKRKTNQINQWKKSGIRVIEGYVSIHDVLPKTRVAITENSTAGIECLMHQVPIISYGFPEYHWATKQLQSLTQLEDLITDLTWHDPFYANKFINWYIYGYLCSDINSTVKRLKEII